MLFAPVRKFSSVVASSIVFSVALAFTACTHAAKVPDFTPQRKKEALPQGQPIHDLDKTLILVSIDGLRPDTLSKIQSPNLWKLIEKGSFAKEGMIPVFPSLTFPNHYTLVTGLRPVKHGIVSNEMKDPNIEHRFSLGAGSAIVNDPRWWMGEPIWNTAQKQGLRSGTMFWPGSEAPIQGMLPTYNVPYDGSMPQENRVAQILKWLDLPKKMRPHFMTLYFEEVDSAGHKFGPKAPETLTAITHEDEAIGLLIQGLSDRKILDHINLIILSDHGMAPIDDKKAVYLGDLFTEFSDVETIGGGALMGLFVKDARTQEKIIQKIKQSTSLVDAYKKKDLPARYFYHASPRIPDVVIVAKESAYILRDPKSSTKGGTHGYDNELTSMRASFIGHGPAFKQGHELKPFSNLNVYNLMCSLLGIKASVNDGDPKWHLSIPKR